MEPTVAAIFAAAAANAVVVLGSVALWLGYRTRRAERQEQRERERAQELLQPVEARLTEITRAMVVIAGQVERVAEAQRHLAVREQSSVSPVPLAPPVAPRAIPRVVTPH